MKTIRFALCIAALAILGSGSVSAGSFDKIIFSIGPVRAVPPTLNSMSAATATPTLIPTPAPNYVDLTAKPDTVKPGGTVRLSWNCDFNRWNYEDVPVNVYLAAVRAPKVSDTPSNVSDALGGGTVYLFGAGMKNVYVYNGSLKEPTFSNAAFPPVAVSDSLQIKAPGGEGFDGEYVFATVFIRCDTGKFVRTDGLPVENSNPFRIQ